MAWWGAAGAPGGTDGPPASEDAGGRSETKRPARVGGRGRAGGGRSGRGRRAGPLRGHTPFPSLARPGQWALAAISFISSSEVCMRARMISKASEFALLAVSASSVSEARDFSKPSFISSIWRA